MPDELVQESTLVNGLRQADAYPHAAEAVELVETHISWVFLAGDFAYKIKKPLSLGFLDFHELASRRFYCEEEIRLNQPWAPEIYLGVVKITLDQGRPRVEGPGTAIEYAVRMRRFDQALRLDRQLQNNQLSVQDMHELATHIAYRHWTAAAVPLDRKQRALELTESLMWDNFSALRCTIGGPALQALHDWTGKQLDLLRATFVERFEQGFYRDCHGDLHLANLVRLPDGITTFDCIEFSADLRQIDVACDVAFLVMDLESKGRDDLAAHFINRYFEKTDDYASMRLFDLYFVYRCLVRAKVAAIRATERDGERKKQQDLAEAKRYLDMAGRQSEKRQPILLIMHGLSGSGKTHISGQLMADLPAIRIRSDLQRKRLFGMAETGRSGSAVAGGIYAPGADAGAYAAMFNRAAPILRAGHNVILDATFLRREYRDQARALATDCSARCVVLKSTAPDAELRRRIRDRGKRGTDASEANLAVLDHQRQSTEPLAADENACALTVDTSNASTDQLSTLVRDLAHRSTE